VVLVAEAPGTGKVVGLLALTAALDVRALQQHFDLSAYDNLDEPTDDGAVPSWVTLRARWVALRARWVTLRARWVTLRARWVTRRARWVMLRARWATLRARWVTFTGDVVPPSFDADHDSDDEGLAEAEAAEAEAADEGEGEEADATETLDEDGVPPVVRLRVGSEI
jgi:hypothetical protein